MHGQQVSNIIAYSFAPAFREQHVTGKCSNRQISGEELKASKGEQPDFSRKAYLEKKYIYQY